MQFEKLFNLFARIIQSRHFVLSAQFAAQFEPVVEESLPGQYDFQRLQGDILVAFGFVVAVEFL